MFPSLLSRCVGGGGIGVKNKTIKGTVDCVIRLEGSADVYASSRRTLSMCR